MITIVAIIILDHYGDCQTPISNNAGGHTWYLKSSVSVFIVVQGMNLNETDSDIKIDCGEQEQSRWNNNQGGRSAQAERGSAFFPYSQGWAQSSRYFDASNVEVYINASDWSFSFKGSNTAHISTSNAFPSIKQTSLCQACGTD